MECARPHPGGCLPPSHLSSHPGGLFPRPSLEWPELPNPSQGTPQPSSLQVSPNPVSKLQGVGDSGAQKDDGDVLRQHDEHLFPHDPTLHTEGGGSVREPSLMWGQRRQ